MQTIAVEEVRSTPIVSMVIAMANNGIPLPAPPSGLTLPPIPRDYTENGRLYHGFRKGQYMFPCDEEEKDKMDIFHKFFLVARRELLHSTPFIRNYDAGPRIMDLGTGTGIWAIDMADKYRDREAEVRGLDLAMIQPTTIPGNLSFNQRDIESPWHGLGLDSWDLIHMRMLNGAITSWNEMYQKVYMHLKPGYGWLEHVEIDFQPRCDDGSLPENSALAHWSHNIIEASLRAYRPLSYNHDTGRMLEGQGFVEIQEQVIKAPLNPWPADPHLKDIGRWFCLGMIRGLEGMTLGPLTRYNGWSKDDVTRLCKDVEKEILSKKIHAYCNMHIWIARRPAEA